MSSATPQSESRPLELAGRPTQHGLATSPGVGGPGLSVRSVVAACFRHRVRMAWIVGAVILCTLLACLFTPKRYEATMQLMVLNTRDNPVISSTSGDVTKTVGDVTDSDVNSQAELVRSRDVLSEAVTQLNGGQLSAVDKDKRIEALGRRLEVEPIRQSNVLNVSFVGPSPAIAEATLQAVASSFVEKELSLRRPAQSSRLFGQLVEESRSRLASAEADLVNLKLSTGIASLADNEAALLRQVESATTEDATLAGQQAETARRLKRLQDVLKGYPQRITTQSRSTPNQRAVEDLTAKLVDLENKRTGLLTGYLPTERNVLEVDHQIATVRAEIEEQKRSAAVEQTTDVNPITQELSADQAKSKVQLSALSAQRAAIDGQRDHYRDQLNLLERHAAEYMSLQKRVAESQQNFDFAVQKRDQAEFDDALDRQRILNVAFAARPSASSVPLQPKPKLYTALGIFTALFLAIGSSIVSELNRRTVYSPAELESLTGVPTVGSVRLSSETDLKQMRATAVSLQVARSADKSPIHHLEVDGSSVKVSRSEPV